MPVDLVSRRGTCMAMYYTEHINSGRLLTIRHLCHDNHAHACQGTPPSNLQNERRDALFQVLGLRSIKPSMRSAVRVCYIPLAHIPDDHHIRYAQTTQLPEDTVQGGGVNNNQYTSTRNRTSRAPADAARSLPGSSFPGQASPQTRATSSGPSGIRSGASSPARPVASPRPSATGNRSPAPLSTRSGSPPKRTYYQRDSSGSTGSRGSDSGDSQPAEAGSAMPVAAGRVNLDRRHTQIMGREALAACWVYCPCW